MARHVKAQRGMAWRSAARKAVRGVSSGRRFALSGNSLHTSTMPRKKPPPRRIGEAPQKRRRRSQIGRISGQRYRDEADFQDEVIRRALANQFKVFHQGDSRRILIGRGFYDLTMISRIAPRILFVELKMPEGEVAQEQAEWGALAQSLKALIPQIEYYLWVPQDLKDINEILKTVPDPGRMQAFNSAMTQFRGIR